MRKLLIPLWGFLAASLWGGTVLVTAGNFYQGVGESEPQFLGGELKSLIFEQMFDLGHIALDNDSVPANPWEDVDDRDRLLAAAVRSGAQRALTLYLVWTEPDSNKKVFLESLILSAWDVKTGLELERRLLFSKEDREKLPVENLENWLKFLEKDLKAFLESRF